MRVDYKVDQFGRKTPIFKRAPDPDYFTYDLDFIKRGADLYKLLGRMPTHSEILYYDSSLHNDILFYIEGLQWADNTISQGD